MYVRVRQETIYPYLKIRTLNVGLILTCVRWLGFQVSLMPILSNDFLIKKKRDKICGKNISIDTIITVTYLSLALILKGKLLF